MTLLTPVIASFKGPYEFLSNFAPSPIVADFGGAERLFPTAEHLFHASKSLFTRDDVPEDWLDKLLNTTAYGSKKMGRALPIDIARWNVAAYKYMYRIQILKYDQNPVLKQSLLNTKDYVLIEGNDHNDKKWGQVAGVGTNWLGLILMDVREALVNEES